MSRALVRTGCFGDAKEYAVSALRSFQAIGAGADVRRTLDLIARIDQHQKLQ
jgi:hypothetical protein